MISLLRICLLILLLVLLHSLLVGAQEKKEEKKEYLLDSVQEKRFIGEIKLPLTLITAGVLVKTIPYVDRKLQNALAWNKDILDGVSQSNPKYINTYDDQLRFLPPIAAYAMNLFGLKSKHRFIDRSAILAVSYVVSDMVVHRLKKATQNYRPDRPITVKDYSFPSQHTAMAFVGATFLHRELGHHSPWISVAGYSVATWVGMSRIFKNRHWSSDVLVGAGVGILCTNLTYMGYDWFMGKYGTRLNIMPTVLEGNQWGMTLVANF